MLAHSSLAFATPGRPSYVRRSVVLVGLGNVGIISALPLLLDATSRVAAALGARRTHVPVLVLAVSQVLSLEIELAVAVFAGLYLADRVGMKTPFIDALLGRVPPTQPAGRSLVIAAGAGVAVGGVIVVLALLFRVAGPGMQPVGRAAAAPPGWVTALATPYGGVTEELLTRLFLVSLIAFVVGRGWRRNRAVNSAAIMVAIVTAAVVFGLAHLPYASIILRGPPSPAVISRTIVLNGIGGLVFGWLFWRRGIESAMVAHLSADVVLHVVPVVALLAARLAI